MIMRIWRRTKPPVGRLAGVFLGGSAFGGIAVGVAMMLLSPRPRQGSESQWEGEA